MSDYAVVSLAERPDLRERLPFGPGWPQFIFHDPVARRLIPDVDRLFADFNLALLDGDDAVVAGGWGVPLAWPASHSFAWSAVAKALRATRAPAMATNGPISAVRRVKLEAIIVSSSA